MVFFLKRSLKRWVALVVEVRVALVAEVQVALVVEVQVALVVEVRVALVARLQRVTVLDGLLLNESSSLARTANCELRTANCEL
jgi:hypothetical protein